MFGFLKIYEINVPKVFKMQSHLVIFKHTGEWYTGPWFRFKVELQAYEVSK